MGHSLHQKMPQDQNGESVQTLALNDSDVLAATVTGSSAAHALTSDEYSVYEFTFDVPTRIIFGTSSGIAATATSSLVLAGSYVYSIARGTVADKYTHVAVLAVSDTGNFTATPLV